MCWSSECNDCCCCAAAELEEDGADGERAALEEAKPAPLS